VGVHAGMMDLADVSLPDDAVYYLCGPVPFMQAIGSDLIERGVAVQDTPGRVPGDRPSCGCTGSVRDFFRTALTAT